MTFQSQVFPDQVSAIIGEPFVDSPSRVKPVIINSSGATPNTIGKAYTYVVGAADPTAGAGTNGGGAFAGILVNPKVYASQGAATGSLDPTLDIPDNTEGELMTMGTAVFNLSIVGTGEIGEGIFYVDATGELGSGVAGGGQTQISNAKIDRQEVFGPGPAIITLTEPE